MDTNLLNEWKTKHLDKGYTGFIADGIVNKDKWDKSSAKICFLLKEAYTTQDSVDLCRWLDDNHHPRLWHTVSDWVYALQNVTETDIPPFTEIDSNETERLRTIAIVNIKKSNGTANSDFSELLKFAQDDFEFIKKQIQEISPNIIVCGNTEYFFQIVYGAKTNEKEEIIGNCTYRGTEIDHRIMHEKGFIWANDTLIMNVCHPANRFSRMGKYYAFAALYQQALREKNSYIDR